ncbi:MAG TPA: alpha-L-arabinofuranosidase C-terminal domain-containing protein [Candidatus Saccharimonadales bacterium]|nr:alpha-L-arabinofuranosidase C-terminal domain-containing protein [Candidatus Saccharimonadales bacterium]
MKRRDFLHKGALGTTAFLLSAKAPWKAAAAPAADSRIEVLFDEPLGTISPNIYGHFAENLGGVLYDGIWVGEKSKVPNTDGLRAELIEHMRKIKAPVIRYPGGCFADSYDWRDGIGPAEKRPRRVNFWANVESDKAPASHRYDPNTVGTNEFVHFCKLIGAEPYLAANVRSLPASAFYQWVDYCNSPEGSTTLADTRAAAGYADPFKVKYWGVGNESWGCGGNFTAQEYAVEFRRYSTWLPTYGDELRLIASGPNTDDWNWTREFLTEIVKKGPGELRRIYGMALHHYAWNMARGKTQDWIAAKGDALKFEPVDWYELLREGQRMEGLITGHWQVLSEIDHNHRIKLIVDEWGPWYRPGGEATPGNILEQIPTLRDAVVSGMTLDIFNRHPEKVAMANCAQLVNCLNSLYLAHEDKFVVTPVGRVFELYAGHQGGSALRSIFSTPTLHYDRDSKDASFWGLQGSASVRDKELTITAVNPSTSDPRLSEISLRGATARSASMVYLTHRDIHAHNSFEQKNVVAPQSKALNVDGGNLVVEFPPASVTALKIQLA